MTLWRHAGLQNYIYAEAEKGVFCVVNFSTQINKESDEQNSKGAVRRC